MKQLFTRHLLFDALLLFALRGFPHTKGTVIPPEWANETLNPCAPESWQLLHWPEDGSCYNIFTQGPCGDTQELYFDSAKGRASCRCSRGRSWHHDSQRCHDTYSQGPCGYKEYFVLPEILEGETPALPHGECRPYEDCPPGHLFWPREGECFLHLSRGPCLHGDLLFVQPNTGTTDCGCQPSLMSTNYWHHGGSCHELFTQGPCVEGHLFVYNLTKGMTECVCGPHLLTNYHHQTGRCYELDTTGPCHQGQVFTYDSVRSEAKCSCLPGYVEWPLSGTCYRAFSRGPCPQRNFFHPDEREEIGTCVKNTCNAGELYDPSTGKCYPVGRRGPCPRGKLWIFERAASVRGLCHCDSHLIGYWGPHAMCYELGERGPCPKRKVLSYDRNTGVLQCRCDFRKGFVPWVNGRCIKAGIRRNKLIPVAGPIRSAIGSNTIPVETVHRGLTLPHQEIEEGSSHRKLPSPRRPKALRVGEPAKESILTEEILKDVLSSILGNISSPVSKNDVHTRVHTETQTERTIHRITVSRSVTERRTQFQELPRRKGVASRRDLKPHRKGEASPRKIIPPRKGTASHRERETPQRERETLQRELETLKRERETTQRERETPQRELETLKRERETLKRERKTTQRERETPQRERETLQRERISRLRTRRVESPREEDDEVIEESLTRRRGPIIRKRRRRLPSSLLERQKGRRSLITRRRA